MRCVRPKQALLNGGPPKGDPEYGSKSAAFPKLARVWIVQDDQLLGVGNVRVRALATPGDSPGGASWSWDACDGSKCLPAVFASSLAPPGKARYPEGTSGSAARPSRPASSDWRRRPASCCSRRIRKHSGGLDRLEKAAGKDDALKNDNACKAYVQQARDALGQALTRKGCRAGSVRGRPSTGAAAAALQAGT